MKTKLIQILASDHFRIIAWFLLSIILIGLTENPQDYHLPLEVVQNYIY